jgi:integrase/recombinase XerD
MFKNLFHSPRVLSRHANAPLAKERNAFLTHLKSLGVSRSTLLRYARQLRVIATMLDKMERSHIPLDLDEIELLGQRWAKSQRQRGRAQSLRGPAKLFRQVAYDWCGFMGWLKEHPCPKPAFAEQVEAWGAFLAVDEGLAERTTSGYIWWANAFLQWLNDQGVPLRQVTVVRVDGFMSRLAAQGLSRSSSAYAAKALRRFFRYAYEKGYCQRNLAPAILSPRLYQQENVPTGPAWADVQRLRAAPQGTTGRDVRNRAILLLLAVYGLRSGEVRGLCLEDLDWTRRIMRVHRSKTARVQECPLTAATGQALRRYVNKVRPDCLRPEIFVTLHAPFRPLSCAALYSLTRRLMDRLDIASPKRGPHSLRHACARHLLNSGSSLKQVGDHLGHRSLSATQVYAKVDLVGLRTVAAFDLGGLI